ncbi:MAG TPA: hypothetical protein VKJ67_21835 [Methylomirabilota bacterium]|nr:hypothetical protein [Methylomirabilota bacterium]
MKRALAALLGVLVVLGAALYFFVVRPLLRPAELTAVAESALATDDLLLLGGINVRQAVFLERWFFGAPRVTAAPAVPPPAVADRTLLEHLRAAGVDPRHDVDYALYAVYPAAEATRHAVVLVGRFNPTAINAYLTRELQATPRAPAGRASYEVVRTDPTTCRPAATWIVTAAPEWIVLADPGSHATLLPRFANPPPENREPLAWWRSLARADVAAVGITGLDRLETGISQPFAKSSAKTLAAEAGAVGRLYLGLGVKPVPPQGVLRIVIDAKDAGRVSEKLRAWEQAVSESRARWKDSMPSVAALYDSLKIHADGSRSTIEFTVDRTLAASSQRVINELLAAALGGFGVRVGGPAAAPPAEQIDTEPLPFVPSITPGSLPAYDPKGQFAEEVDQIQGSFGLRLGELRLSADPAVGLEMDVEGFAKEIPNLGGSDERARLFLDSVKAAGGQELLRAEACGRERNTLPASFKTSGSHRLKATKTVRLIPGADPRALQSASGRVQLRLPVRTEVVSLDHPKAGASVERRGAIFTVTKVEGGAVAYQIAGARDRLLAFRALNSKGQPLASPSSFSSEFMFGEGVSGQRNYAGSVERLEIVFAVDEEAVELPFTLTDFAPAVKGESRFLDQAPPFRPYGYQALQRDYPRARGAGAGVEPFELSLDKVQSFFGLRLDVTFRSPEVPNFEKAFGVGRLRLTRVQLRDGAVIEPPPADAANPAAAMRSRWESPIRFGGSPKDGRLSTALNFYIDSKAKPEDLKAAQGVLTLRFPKALDTLALDELTVGRKAQLGDLTVTVVARGRKSVTLQTNRDGDRVYYIRLIGPDGQALGFFGPNITEAPDGAWRFELSPLNPAARAEIVVAREVDQKSYPVSLTP